MSKAAINTVPLDRQPRPDPDRPGVFIVPLTMGKTAIIDAADAAIVGTSCWQWTPQRGNVVRAHHASRVGPYQLRQLLTGADGSRDVLHRNGDRLDFRRTNLVVGSKSLTRFRDPKKKRNQHGNKPSSQYKGVYWSKACGKWAAMARVHRKQQHLGLFVNERDAADAYDKAVRQASGPLARLNFPESQHRDDAASVGSVTH